MPVPTPRRPRFRRASEPPAFRLADDDVVIVRQLSRCRFLRSPHIAELVGRSLDRTNDRLSRLFHAGYIDRPHAQLDYYPTAGSALWFTRSRTAARAFLIKRYGVELTNVDWRRKNDTAGRPFIEHQLEIVDLQIGLNRGVHDRKDVSIMHADDLIARMPERPTRRNPFALRVKFPHKGMMRDIAAIPDFVFGIKIGAREAHSYVVEIDRGTMPIVRSNIEQTSFERKMRAYLTACAAKQHSQSFGWKSFRVLTVTTDEYRKKAMIEALNRIHIPRSPGPGLFLFTTREALHNASLVGQVWQEASGKSVSLI